MYQQSSHNRVWFLMARSLSGEATHEEQQELLSAIQYDFTLQQQFELFRKMWDKGNYFEDNLSDDKEKKSISRILQLAAMESVTPKEETFPPVSGRKKRRRVFLFTSSTAVLLIVFFVCVNYSSNQKAAAGVADKKNIQTLEAKKGSRTRTLLPDGSTVWLNAGSRIFYEGNFSGATREVRLEGEAYFDVVKEPQHPFIVHVAGYDIKVLGTVFNVRSYPYEKTIETTLFRGLVQLTEEGDKKKKPIYLYANEKLILEKIAANTELALSNNNITGTENSQKDYQVIRLDSNMDESRRMETAWLYNRLEFRGDNFEALAEKMERWYNISVVFEDDAVKHLNFNGSFENETVQQAFKALEAATPFSFTITGRTVTIKSAGKK